MQEKKTLQDEEAAIEIAKNLKGRDLMLYQKNPEIRTEQAGQAASFVASIPKVREALFKVQQDFAENPVDERGNPLKGAILDGRDIGTVICPDAEVKIFLTASEKIRAQRRLKQLQLKGICANIEKVLSDLQERDARDRNRSTAPLKAADDAFILDTSDLTADEVSALVVRYLENRGIQ